LGKLKKIGIGIGVAFLALMVTIVYYASLDIPDLELMEIKLDNVELLDVNSIENKVKLQTTFLVKNPSEKTFTVPIIAYELYVNGKCLAEGKYSTEDIAMPDRVRFYPGSEKPLKNIFVVILTDTNAQEYQSIIEGESLQYSVKGIVTVETAWSLIEKDFKSPIGFTPKKTECPPVFEEKIEEIPKPKISDRAVADIVKQYKGKDGKGDRLVDVLATLINIAYPNENILDNPSSVVDWYAFEDHTKRDGIYKVSFIFETYKENTEFIWYVDIKTNNISAGTTNAKDILNTLDIFD